MSIQRKLRTIPEAKAPVIPRSAASKIASGISRFFGIVPRLIITNVDILYRKLYEGEGMVTIALKCPFCGSEDVRAYGAYSVALEHYTALGMKTPSGSRYKNIGEQLKALRNKGSLFFLILPLRP
jgi:hypothetical protein